MQILLAIVGFWIGANQWVMIRLQEVSMYMHIVLITYVY